jgi:hypothetical protein
MGEHGVGTSVATPDLRTEQPLEGEPAAGARPGPEGQEPDVGRAPMATDVVAEDDHLVTATGQGVNHVDRLREGWVIRVYDLGDEDDPHG